MNAKKFSEAMNNVNKKYVDEAINYRVKKKYMQNFVKWGAVAACVCIIAAGGVMITRNSGSIQPVTSNVPNPEAVQVPNPIISVSSSDEMNRYLDFNVPILDKDVDEYSVIVYESYPEIGQVDYADGSEFRIKYGSEDISGIYGGELVKTEKISETDVELYEYTNFMGETTTYAVWMKNGFSYSYIYKSGDYIAEIEAIIEQCK